MKIRIPRFETVQKKLPCYGGKGCKVGFDCDKCNYKAVVELFKKLNGIKRKSK